MERQEAHAPVNLSAMAQPATVLILADVDDAERASLEGACAEAGFLPVVEPSAEAATSKLTAKRFDALIVHLGTPGAALACMRARGKLLRTRIPVIALVDTEDDAAFSRAYRAGADEVLVIGRPAWLTARLRSLPKSSIPQPGNARGDAVVADADRTRAEVIERVLRDAGFRVEVAVDGFSTRLQAGRPSLKVAVVDASLEDLPALILQAKAKGSRCAWVVRARPEQLDELRQQLSHAERVAVVTAYGPPEDILFETNRLIEPRATDGRGRARLLYGTILRLRWQKDGLEEIGYSYNVSAAGLFVRTLVAPSGRSVAIDLAPPGSDARVHLDCEVVWRREVGATRKEPVPAGFGVRIVGGDLDLWTRLCPSVPSLPPVAVQSTAPDRAHAEAVPTAQDSGNGAIVDLPMPRVTRPPAFVTKPSDVEIRPREAQSSVEEMLASVLSETIADDEAVGAAPLSIDGDSVVELHAGGEASDPHASDEPVTVPIAIDIVGVAASSAPTVAAKQLAAIAEEARERAIESKPLLEVPRASERPPSEAKAPRPVPRASDKPSVDTKAPRPVSRASDKPIAEERSSRLPRVESKVPPPVPGSDRPEERRGVPRDPARAEEPPFVSSEGPVGLEVTEITPASLGFD